MANADALPGSPLLGPDFVCEQGIYYFALRSIYASLPRLSDIQLCTYGLDPASELLVLRSVQPSIQPPDTVVVGIDLSELPEVRVKVSSYAEIATPGFRKLAQLPDRIEGKLVLLYFNEPALLCACKLVDPV